MGKQSTKEEFINKANIVHNNKYDYSKFIYIRSNKKRYNVDAYNPETNTIYEFYGDYWHGNPKKFESDDVNKRNYKTFGTLYNNTIEREKELINFGFKVISIWEEDFILKLLLRKNDK